MSVHSNNNDVVVIVIYNAWLCVY